MRSVTEKKKPIRDWHLAMLVASRSYSGFENRNELQSPHEEDSFVEGDRAVWVRGWCEAHKTTLRLLHLRTCRHGVAIGLLLHASFHASIPASGLSSCCVCLCSMRFACVCHASVMRLSRV
jgi:hypothetical protein